MRECCRDALAAGYRLAGKGIPWSDVLELVTVRKLNARAVTSWTLQNGGGDNITERRRAELKRREESATDKAREICKAHGWELTIPGLWWTVRRAGDECGENLLSGL